MRKRNEWSFIRVRSMQSIIDMTVTNVVNIPIGANVRNIKCEIAEKF